MGCQMNRLDSELVSGALRAAGHEVIKDRRSADVVLYNTCSVRQHAEEKVVSRLGADGQRKAAGRKLIVGVLGCMAQREGGQLRLRFPQLDLLCAPGQLARLTELIDEAAAGRPAVALDPARGEPSPAAGPPAGAPCRTEVAAGDVAPAAGTDELELARDPTEAPSPGQAFVRAMRGCDRFCGYCIVPFVRGPQRSRDPRHIHEEVRGLVDAGRTQITLLGQTVNSYRWTYGETTVWFSDLLAGLSGISGLRRLRFVTSHPMDFGDDILEAMRDLPNVCEYMHCPAQSGSDAVLKRMNRGYRRAQYDELVDRARGLIPGVVLAGDFIVGFPGETEQDHQASAELIRRSGYKNSFVFKYSPRPGTSAARRWADDVPTEVKKRRNNELLAVQDEVGLAHHRPYVGAAMEVLVEGPSPRAGKQARHSGSEVMQLVGRTRGDHIVVFDGPADLAGRYVDVSVTGATPLTLFGEIRPG